MRRRAARCALALLLLLPGACSASPGGTPAPPPSITSSASASGSLSGSTPRVPRWDHVVIVIMGTRSYAQVIGSSQASFVNLLARSGASFTDAHAVGRPSSANYFALFSGSTQSVTTDTCRHTFRAPNVATELTAAGYSFAAFSQELPRVGYRGCELDAYTAVHNPLVSFTNVPASMNQPLAAFHPDYDQLPDVSFVIPDLNDSMTESEVVEGDTWLRETITGYAAWASSHRSLLVITWDQAPTTDSTNHIPMVAVGANVAQGPVSERVDHYRLLATVEDGFALPRLGNTSGISAIAALGG